MRAIEFRGKLPLFGAAILAIAGATSAQVLACEQFNYADGDLVGNGGWANHSGSGSFIQVASGQAVLSHGSGSREDANMQFGVSSGNVYYAFDFSVDDLGSPYVGTDNEYFAHFKDTGFNFAARMDIVAAAAAGDFSVGIASDESTADATWATDLSYATTYRVVVRYDQDANIAELWIDPALETDTSILGEDRSDPGDVITQFGLRQSTSSANETINVDNIMVGSTFADVVSNSTTCGSQVARFSAIPNPGVLSPGNAPYTGTTWNPTVTAAGTSDVLILSFTPGIDLATPFGSLLCNLPVSDAFTYLGASGAPFAVAIPADPTLAGVGICTQGAGVGIGAGGGLALELTNALDIVIGG